MEILGVFEFLNSIGIPLAMCGVLGIIIAWIWFLHRQITLLRQNMADLVSKSDLANMVAKDICSLQREKMARAHDRINQDQKHSLQRLEDQLSQMEERTRNWGAIFKRIQKQLNKGD